MSKRMLNNEKLKTGADKSLSSDDNSILTKIKSCMNSLIITFEERIFAKSGKAPTYER